MITLGVIGVVAAITIPSIVQNQQKRKIESLLKEDYAIIQQVMKFTEYDDVSLDLSVPDSLAGMKLWFETFMAPHLKYVSVCYDKAGCWQDKGPTRTLKGGNATGNRTGIGIGSGILTVKLSNGTNLCIDGFKKDDMKNWFGTNTTSSSLVVYIDANADNNFLPLPEKSVKADIIYLCSPNNPTGAVYNKEQLKAWVDYANENHSVILFDAAYECFVTDENLPRSIYEIEGAKTCAIEFCSLSKWQDLQVQDAVIQLYQRY